MNRREIREQIFKMLFQAEFHEMGEFEELFGFFMDELEETNKDKRAYIEKKVRDIYGNISYFEALIN